MVAGSEGNAAAAFPLVGTRHPHGATRVQGSRPSCGPWARRSPRRGRFRSPDGVAPWSRVSPMHSLIERIRKLFGRGPKT